MKKLITCVLAAAALAGTLNLHAQAQKKLKAMPTFYKVGHRGTRGLMPENTIPAMYKAIDLGVNTLEIDVHITKDNKVLVYHDEDFDPRYTQMPDGSEINPADREKFNFYKMNYSAIRPFIIGLKPYPAFPQQQRIRTYAPLMTEMIDSVERYTRQHKLKPAIWLIEIKADTKADGIKQPVPEEFVSIIMKELKGTKVMPRVILQSFDKRQLQALHKLYPAMPVGFIVGKTDKTVQQHLDELGFNPDFYNVDFNYVNAEMVKYIQERGMGIFTWTVNKTEQMKEMKRLGVNGIVTDYPNLFKEAGI